MTLAGQPSPRDMLGRYLFAVGVIGVATIVKMVLPDLIGREVPVSLYLGAIMVAAWFGGTGPGLLATLLGTVTGYYWFIRPYGTWGLEDAASGVRVIMGAIEGTVISLLAGALQKATLAAKDRSDSLATANSKLAQELEARGKAEAALLVANDQLERLHRLQAAGTLAGRVARDFDDLLGGILDRADRTLPSLPPEAPGRANLEELRNLAKRGTRLTQELLAFAGKGTRATRAIDLAGAVHDLEPMLRVLLGDAADLQISSSGPIAQVLLDPSQLVRVLASLASNAADAMSEGGQLKIDLAATNLDNQAAGMLGLKAGDYVRLSVTDDGAGIDPAVIGQIFEPFFTTKPGIYGSGLGLSIVFGIVADAGGCIGVESKLGVGTTFTIHLPVAKEMPATPPVEEGSASAA
jgi:signal transduction histidine kinase